MVKEFDIFLLQGSNYDLTKYDFSSIKAKIFDISRDDFRLFMEESFLEKLGESNQDFLDRIVKYKNKVFAVVPSTFQEKCPDTYWAFRFLLLIYPSSLICTHTINYRLQVDSQKYEWEIRLEGDHYIWDFWNNLLEGSDENIDEINEFFELFWVRVNRLKYIQIGLASYEQSFTENNLNMSFLSLCIVLESTTSQATELTYRLSRNAAILCGKDKESSQKIFKRVKEIYKLRSRMVHGDEYDKEAVYQEVPFLRKLCSKLIIEMISQNLRDKEELNQRITEVGFGDRKKISSEYKEWILNENVLQGLSK